MPWWILALRLAETLLRANGCRGALTQQEQSGGRDTVVPTEHVIARRRRGWARSAPAGALAVLMLAGCAAGHSASGASASTVGAILFTTRDRPRLPAVSGQLVGGGKLNLAADRGHVVVLNFWGSWCSACQQEAPALSAAARQFQKSSVRFVGIDVADEPASAIAFMHRYKIRYPSLNDPGDQVAPKFGDLVPVVYFPSTLVVAASGKVVGRVIGAITSHDLKWLIDAALSAGSVRA